MIICGCSTTPPSETKAYYQENLLTECPEVLPRLTGTTGAAFDALVTAYKYLYLDCAVRHNALIKEIRK
nr:hypothetical protein [Pragia fontium]